MMRFKGEQMDKNELIHIALVEALVGLRQCCGGISVFGKEVRNTTRATSATTVSALSTKTGINAAW